MLLVTMRFFFDIRRRKKQWWTVKNLYATLLNYLAQLSVEFLTVDFFLFTVKVQNKFNIFFKWKG